jgi:hypothetical protein
MKKALLVLLFATSLVHAGQEDPFEKVDMSKNFTNKITLTVQAVANPTDACHKERLRRGFTSRNQSVDACTFWEQNQCTIIVGLKTDRDTLGHELQHCLQGPWH